MPLVAVVAKDVILKINVANKVVISHLEGLKQIAKSVILLTINLKMY